MKYGSLGYNKFKRIESLSNRILTRLPFNIWYVNTLSSETGIPVKTINNVLDKMIQSNTILIKNDQYCIRDTDK